MAQVLVNGLYPLQYFVLDSVDQIQYPNEFWWQSKMRYASEGDRGQYNANGIQTAEYLEIDMSRIRQVNYLNFSIIRAPINITIEYDALSDTDSSHNWVEVTPQPEEKFVHAVHYNAKQRAAWLDAEFYFTDSQGHPINTRFIRITFQRRDEEWPHTGASPFRWSVLVKGLRPARFVNEYVDTRGTLADSGIPADSDASHVLMGITETQYDNTSTTTTDWVKQQFGLPFDTLRGDISPNLMGFSMLFYVEQNGPTQEFITTPNESLVQLQWQLYDVTNRTGDPILLRSGIESGALTDQRTWINVYFDPENLIATDFANVSPIYELWVKSLSVNVDLGVVLSGDGSKIAYEDIRQVLGKFVEQPRATTGQSLLTASATNGSNHVVFDNAALAGLLQNGDFIQRVDRVDPAVEVLSVAGATVTLTAVYPGSSVYTEWERCLPITIGTGGTPDYTMSGCLHIWADVADNGRDVLGNSYRYGVRKDAAPAVLDTEDVGWMSGPQPSPNAVEALYFDTRYTDINDELQPAVIDAIKIEPRTPGVVMHVYYTSNHNTSITPQTTDQWDRLIWTPVNATYTLNGNATITLPTTIRASYVKLEFSKLQPRPIHLPTRPKPPYSRFRRYPSWVENQFDNSTIKRTVQDWYANATKQGLVTLDALKYMTSPILEFQYMEREFLAALATNSSTITNSTNPSLVNTTTNTFIDPTTASKINVNTPQMYGAPLTLITDRTSILGQTIAASVDPRVNNSAQEGGFQTISGIPNVSTSNSRVSESFAHIAQTPMWFNKTGRHIYKIDEARFNKQAYYVGISNVSFLRIDYSQARDDTLITENLYDNFLIETNTWVADNPSLIALMVGTGSSEFDTGNTVNLLVTYTVDGITYTDEQIQFDYFDQVVDLINIGSTQAINVQVYLANTDGSEGVLYSAGQDYVMNFDTDPTTGLITNSISIDTASIRLIVGPIPINYDSGVVVSTGVIGGSDYLAGPNFDSAKVIGVAAIGTSDTYTP